MRPSIAVISERLSVSSPAETPETQDERWHRYRPAKNIMDKRNRTPIMGTGEEEFHNAELFSATAHTYVFTS